jgi:hypothetical protein
MKKKIVAKKTSIKVNKTDYAKAEETWRTKMDRYLKSGMDLIRSKNKK